MIPSAVASVREGRVHMPVHEPVQRAVYAASMVLPLLPLVIGRIYTLSFSPPARGATASIASAAAHPAAVWQQLIAVVASLLLPIGMIGLTRLALPGSPKLALIGGALALMGFVTYPAWIAQDTLTNLMGQAGGGPRLVELWDQLNTSAVLDVYLVVFIVGHFFGPLLLAVALARGGVVPAWPAIAIAVSIPLHVLNFTFVTGLWFLDPIAYALLLIALVPAAVATLRAPSPEVRS